MKEFLDTMLPLAAFHLGALIHGLVFLILFKNAHGDQAIIAALSQSSFHVGMVNLSIAIGLQQIRIRFIEPRVEKADNPQFWEWCILIMETVSLLGIGSGAGSTLLSFVFAGSFINHK